MQLTKLTKLTKEELNYIAGFIDGDGCILAQIIARKDYKFKFEIRVSINMYQKTKYHWFLLQIQNKLNLGTLRKRKDNMTELCIIGNTPVKTFLILILPYLKIKKSIAKLVLDIIEKLEVLNNRDDFIEVCKLVDKIAEFSDSKKRFINSNYVINFFNKN